MSVGRTGTGAPNRWQGRTLAAAGLLLAAGLPTVLWHRVVAAVVAGFEPSARYFVMGWTPWVLMAAGFLCLVPVAVAEGRHSDDPWFPRRRNAYLGWGISLYLLGFGLATQVAQLWTLSAHA